MCPVNITNSIITASSTLLAVGITLYFTNRREKNKFLQDLKLKEYIDLETFYVNLLSSIEMTIRYTERGENYKDLFQEKSIISAKANLIAPEEINQKLNDVSELMFIWSSYYRKSLPSKIGDTGFGMISNKDIEFKEKADQEFPKLQQEIGQLVNLIKQELKTQKERLKK